MVANELKTGFRPPFQLFVRPKLGRQPSGRSRDRKPPGCNAPNCRRTARLLLRPKTAVVHVASKGSFLTQLSVVPRGRGLAAAHRSRVGHHIQLIFAVRTDGLHADLDEVDRAYGFLDMRLPL